MVAWAPAGAPGDSGAAGGFLNAPDLPASVKAESVSRENPQPGVPSKAEEEEEEEVARAESPTDSDPERQRKAHRTE